MIATDPATSIDSASLKSGGIIMQRDDGFFAIRLKLIGGALSAMQLRRIAGIAEKHGRGEVRLTARQGIEIPWIRFDDIESVRKELAEDGLDLGPCGPRFRTVTACPGLPICRKALVDSQRFARMIDSRFSGKLLPHKFKATVSACPNACSRPFESDIGFCAAAEPQLEKEACIGCGLCLDICKEKALTLQGLLPMLNGDRCISCADCIDCCPAGAWKAEKSGYSVYAGGRMGRYPMLGKKIADFVDEEMSLYLIQRCLEFYLQYGNKRERLGDLIIRTGMDKFMAFVLQEG
jgi:dissimilatory sulfite reductase (desulfoviridin) alpha/beta subunit